MSFAEEECPFSSESSEEDGLEDSSNERVVGLLQSAPFLRSAGAGVSSGAAAFALHSCCEDGVFEDYLPSSDVFSVFIMFASLVAAFRTTHALLRYMEAAALLHKLAACHFDVACTLVSFCRFSSAPRREMDEFQHTLVRLLSMLNALCLGVLERKMTKVKVSFRFEVLGWDELSEAVQESLRTADSHCKVEHLVQAIHNLVVDSMKSGVLSIPPPILTRSFQELGAGVTCFHEAKKLSCVPLPYAYQFLTRTVLVAEALWVPFMLIKHTRHPLAALFSTFILTYFLWYLNELADSLDNPFQRASSSLNPPSVQQEFNMQLWGLLMQAHAKTPAMSNSWLSRRNMRKGKTANLSALLPRSCSDQAFVAHTISGRPILNQADARPSTQLGTLGWLRSSLFPRWSSRSASSASSSTAGVGPLSSREHRSAGDLQEPAWPGEQPGDSSPRSVPNLNTSEASMQSQVSFDMENIQTREYFDDPLGESRIRAARQQSQVSFDMENTLTRLTTFEDPVMGASRSLNYPPEVGDRQSESCRDLRVGPSGMREHGCAAAAHGGSGGTEMARCEDGGSLLADHQAGTVGALATQSHSPEDGAELGGGQSAGEFSMSEDPLSHGRFAASV